MLNIMLIQSATDHAGQKGNKVHMKTGIAL